MDYRKLNEVTVKDKFSMSIIDDLLDELRGARVFSKIDLKAYYRHIKMEQYTSLKLLLKHATTILNSRLCTLD